VPKVESGTKTAKKGGKKALPAAESTAPIAKEAQIMQSKKKRNSAVLQGTANGDAKVHLFSCTCTHVLT
jgi:hypothetical protein